MGGGGGMGFGSVSGQREGSVNRKDLLAVGRGGISILENSEMMGQSPL